MSKASEAGKAFMAGVFAKLPEAQRAQVEAAFNDAQAEDALVVIGTGALAQPEINRRLDELRTKEQELSTRLEEATNLYEQNVQWRETNQAALSDYTQIKPEYDRLRTNGGSGVTKPNEPPVDPKKVVYDAINEAGRDYVGVSAWLAAKAVEHLHMFGEPLPATELVADSKLGRPVAGQPGRVYSLQDAYDAKYGERVATKYKEAENKKFEDEVQKRLTEERKKLASQPFPIRGGAEPSVLDVLQTKDGSSAFTVDSAVATYEALQQARGGG